MVAAHAERKKKRTEPSSLAWRRARHTRCQSTFFTWMGPLGVMSMGVAVPGTLVAAVAAPPAPDGAARKQGKGTCNGRMTWRMGSGSSLSSKRRALLGLCCVRVVGGGGGPAGGGGGDDDAGARAWAGGGIQDRRSWTGRRQRAPGEVDDMAFFEVCLWLWGEWIVLVRKGERGHVGM